MTNTAKSAMWCDKAAEITRISWHFGSFSFLVKSKVQARRNRSAFFKLKKKTCELFKIKSVYNKKATSSNWKITTNYDSNIQPTYLDSDNRFGNY